MLQHDAACCSVLQCIAVCSSIARIEKHISTQWCGAECCRVLQCGAVWCSVLQRVALCGAVLCSVLQCVAV